MENEKKIIKNCNNCKFNSEEFSEYCKGCIDEDKWENIPELENVTVYDAKKGDNV